MTAINYLQLKGSQITRNSVNRSRSPPSHTKYSPTLPLNSFLQPEQHTSRTNFKRVYLCYTCVRHTPKPHIICSRKGEASEFLTIFHYILAPTQFCHSIYVWWQLHSWVVGLSGFAKTRSKPILAQTLYTNIQNIQNTHANERRTKPNIECINEKPHERQTTIRFFAFCNTQIPRTPPRFVYKECITIVNDEPSWGEGGV